jgi:pimeloyl-ACP methyl ester carboxylesterase
MSISFLPLDIGSLTEPASIALAQQIQCQGILTPLCPQPIQTAYVRQGGDGQRSVGSHRPPILLLHGFDSSVLEFRRLLPLLACEQETWAVDSLGFGFTERPAGVAMSPLAIRTHLFAAWQTLIQQPVVLVGASMGGAAAIDFALTYPQAVQALVLIDSAGFRSGPPLGKFLIPPLGQLATAFLRHPQVRQRISCNAYHDPSFASQDAQYCAALHLSQPRWREALIAFTQSGGYGSFREKLAELAPPTLILWGESDRILGTQDAEGFHQAIPRSKLIWIPACGHVPHLEQPQLTAQHLLNFLHLE